jgi:hypothetical protein
LGVGDILINGGTFEYEINTTLLTADLLYGDNNSTLTLTNNPLLTMIDLGSNAVVPLFTKFTLIAYDGLWNGGTFLGHPDDSAFNFGANTWLINYNDTTPGSNFVADATLEGTAFVTITAIVPEPSTWLLGIIGLVALACRAWAGIRWAAETAAETVSGTFS